MMLTSLRQPATWIALLALLVAGAGTGYAAAQLTGADIKNASLTGKDIKNGSLSAKDGDGSFEGERGPIGPRGPAGATGATGPGTTFTTVTNVVNSAGAVTQLEGTADCALGAHVVSGGHVLTSGTNVTDVNVTRSYAVDTDSWLIRAFSSTSQTIQLTVIATCAS
jgi:hypothetical protein